MIVGASKKGCVVVVIHDAEACRVSIAEARRLAGECDAAAARDERALVMTFETLEGEAWALVSTNAGQSAQHWRLCADVAEAYAPGVGHA
jgi:hypothetical protein